MLRGSFRGLQNPQPDLLMCQKEGLPLVQHGRCDGETAADLFHRAAPEIRGQNSENEKQAVGGVRNDEIRENGMGMAAAGTPYPPDPDGGIDDLPVDVVDDTAPVAAMWNAVPPGTAYRADLGLFRKRACGFRV